MFYDENFSFDFRESSIFKTLRLSCCTENTNALNVRRKCYIFDCLVDLNPHSLKLKIIGKWAATHTIVTYDTLR